MFQNLISRYGNRLRDFSYEAQKKAKTTARDQGLQGWNDVAVWRDFKPIYIPADIRPHYLEHVMSERFTRRL
jgi:N12 class adenine-specific DNA methylase